MPTNSMKPVAFVQLDRAQPPGVRIEVYDDPGWPLTPENAELRLGAFRVVLWEAVLAAYERQAYQRENDRRYGERFSTARVYLEGPGLHSVGGARPYAIMADIACQGIGDLDAARAARDKAKQCLQALGFTVRLTPPEGYFEPSPTHGD